MKKQNLMIYLFFASIIFLSSCKGKDGEVGPAGTPGENYDPARDWSFKEGFLRGTATGNLLDGSAFSYNLDYQGNYSGADNGFKIISPTETEVSISKVYSGEGDAFIYGEVNMSFTVTSLNDLSSPELDRIGMDFIKDLGDNNFHQTYYSYYSGSLTGSGSVSNLNFNSSTGILTGNYTLVVPANTERGSLSITDGTFSTRLGHIVARVSAK